MIIDHSSQRAPPPPPPPTRKQSSASTAHTNGPSAYRPAPTPPTPATPALDRSTSQRTPNKVTKPADLGRANTTRERERERDRPSPEKKAPLPGSQPKPTSAKPSPVSSTSDLPLKQLGANSALRDRDPRAQQNQAPPSAAASSLAKVSGVATPRRREKKDKGKEEDIIKRLQAICTDADPTKLYRNLVKIGQG
jgi:p21-activated kinase 1